MHEHTKLNQQIHTWDLKAVDCFLLIGQKTRRPSTVNLPVSNSARKGSSCCLSSCPRSRSAAAHSLSRAASEISEIEYIDVTDQNEPLLDYTEDQQTLDSLEKELKVLRNLSGK